MTTRAAFILVVVVAFTLGAFFTIMVTERDAEAFVCFPVNYSQGE